MTASFGGSSEAIPRGVNYNASITLEYHEVVEAADRSLADGVVVGTGHMRRLAEAYDPQRHLITFDDGYRSAHDLVLPIFAAEGVPAVVSMINALTRDGGYPEADPGYLSRAELHTLAVAGWGIAFHARTLAEHELDYRRMADILLTGTLPGSTPLSLDDPAAATRLAEVVGFAAPELLTSLRALRMQVVERTTLGKTPRTATIEVLSSVFEDGRTTLATLASLPREQIDTFVYPHSENDDLVREAASRAGFLRGYAGGPIGEEGDSYNLRRSWMNDASEIPMPDPAPRYGCLPGAQADLNAGYCVDESSAYGPFTETMTLLCERYGGGPACRALTTIEVDGRTIEVVRWSRSFAHALRGTTRCMPGATLDATFPAQCVEEATASASGIKEAYGPFTVEAITACGSSDACLSNRWAYSEFARVMQP